MHPSTVNSFTLTLSHITVRGGKITASPSMSRFPEITSLFASLASNLQAPNPRVTDEIDNSISNLNRSLNLSEIPKTRVLDTALSLMCFTSPQVYDSAFEYTVRTIVTILTSSVECKAFRVNNEQVMKVGGSIMRTDVATIMDWCDDLLGKLEGHKGDLCDLLLYSVIRLAALAPSLYHAITLRSKLEMKFNDGITSFLEKTLCRLPNEIIIGRNKIPLRCDQDVSDILWEFTQRPFLYLRSEFYERVDWRHKLICLVMSPTFFVETRALLHHWFLVTGLGSTMELQTELVVQLLDLISRPMSWGMSMEVGSKLPFSHAYFPSDNQWLRILSGPITQECFQHLLHVLCGSISHTGRQLQTSSKKIAKDIAMVDHKSLWSLAMNFPGWFSFACFLLFHNSPTDSSYLGFNRAAANSYLLNGVEEICSAAAASYIAWIMNPMNKSHQDLFVDFLVKVSKSWTVKCFSLNKGDNVTKRHLKESRRLKLHDKSGVTSRDLDYRTVGLWIMEFHDIYATHFEGKVGFSTSEAAGFSSQHNLLLQRIPLGILLGYVNHLNTDGCALLLHYAATGTIKSSLVTQIFGENTNYGLKQDSVEWTKEYTQAEAVAGCRVVFEITDVSESICPAIFDTEEEELNFACQLKLKTGDYLVKCINRLLELQFDKDQTRRDLLSRVIRWRHQGRDVYQCNKDMDHVCNVLSMQ